MAASATAVLEAIDRATARERLLGAGVAEEGGIPEAGEKLAALLDAARALASHRIPYALIGGVAVGIHSGVPRATLDVDLAVHTTRDRAAVVQALIAVGFRLVGEHLHSVNLRHPTGEPLQLAFDPTFDPMIDRAEAIAVGSRTILIVRKDDLIEMKRRAAAAPNRRRSKALRDRADVELLCGDVPDPDEGW